METIRKNAFETNSSSSHSLTIDASFNPIDTIIPDENGIITFDGNYEFGWDQDDFYGSYMKIIYCLIDLGAHQSSHRDEDGIKMLLDVIKEHTGAKEIIIEIDSGSYIDHQSCGVTNELFESKEKLVNFIFNPDSYFSTDNDNH